MPHTLLIGKNGQVGWELQRSLAPLGEVIALDHDSTELAADFSRPEALAATVQTVQPTVIVNAAAHTAVDKAESDADRAMAVNGLAPGILAEEAKRRNALLVHYSTDYVFDGSKTDPATIKAGDGTLNFEASLGSCDIKLTGNTFKGECGASLISCSVSGTRSSW